MPSSHGEECVDPEHPLNGDMDKVNAIDGNNSELSVLFPSSEAGTARKRLVISWVRKKLSPWPSGTIWGRRRYTKLAEWLAPAHIMTKQ